MKKKQINLQTGEETIIELGAEEVSAIEAQGIIADKEHQDTADAKITADAKLASGKQKLKDLGLDDDEVKQIVGI